ncbi:hypothetical protein ACFV4P_13905 [Kitasatospora sp. NPDC059795]|uniref:hypothetical protein n=1 Tax=unclassified Kitasatospora TaxID=2633591 RepID=UPI000AE307BA|nr:hypothetical protein [Kitasatospora sp. CB01950]
MGKMLKRAAMSTAALVAATTAVVGTGVGASQASASTVIVLGTPYSAGVYSAPNAGSAKVGVPDLHPGDSVAVNCWTVGGNVGNFGDVWYHAFQEIYAGAPYQQVGGWVFAPYVDGAAAFHNGWIPKC